MIKGDEARAISKAYYTEMNEFKSGIHPSQVEQRIYQNLTSNGVQFQNITYLNWNCAGPRVKVNLDNKDYGIYNYESNKFERRY